MQNRIPPPQSEFSKLLTKFEEQVLKIERFHNHLSDQAWVWWPFLFLKPAQNQCISLKRILIMTPCFSLYLVAGRVLIQLYWKGVPEASEIFKSLVITMLFFLVWFNVVTAFFWNRRAVRLSSGS